MDDHPLTSDQGPPAPTPAASGARRRAPSIGVAGFILALVGLVLPPLGVVGLVLAVLGLAEARRSNLPTRLCLAGVVLGLLACLVGLSLIVQWVLTP
ncbi:MAG TPA: DUF4190 domain-containing protein [Thermoleophilia bacterium]|nr:DUF4190 domain-containing protein [Thermoleophilia bacterium]